MRSCLQSPSGPVRTRTQSSQCRPQSCQRRSDTRGIGPERDLHPVLAAGEVRRRAERGSDAVRSRGTRIACCPLGQGLLLGDVGDGARRRPLAGEGVRRAPALRPVSVGSSASRVPQRPCSAGRLRSGPCQSIRSIRRQLWRSPCGLFPRDGSGATPAKSPPSRPGHPS